MRTLPLLLAAFAITAPHAVQAQDSAASREFAVDSGASWIRILAYPDGPMRRFGHHHVIAHRGISGTVTVAPDPHDSRLMLELGVAALEVDVDELRAAEGEDFAKEVPQKDKDGTRANMLGDKLLDGERFPLIRIESDSITGSMPDVAIETTVTVKGANHSVTFPASVELTDETFVARGELELTHAALGLAPFTALGGALSVRDLLVLRYEISGKLAATAD